MLTVSYFLPDGTEVSPPPIMPTGIGEDSYPQNPHWPVELQDLVRRMGRAFGPDGIPRDVVPKWAQPRVVAKAVAALPEPSFAEAVGVQVSMFDMPTVEKKRPARKSAGRKRTPDKPQGA